MTVESCRTSTCSRRGASIGARRGAGPRRWLTGAGLRPTRQRLALAELLVGDGRNRHVTAEGLHEAARRHGAPVSLATVYNTLRAFCGARLMQEVTVDGSRSYFDTRVDAHPHYYWEEDGRLTDAPTEAAVLAGAAADSRRRRARPHRPRPAPAQGPLTAYFVHMHSRYFQDAFKTPKITQDHEFTRYACSDSRSDQSP